MVGYFVVSIVSGSLTWTTGSLTHVNVIFFANIHVYTHRGLPFIDSFKWLLLSLHRIWLQRNLEGGGGAQSLEHKSHPSIWWPCSIVLNFGFREWALLLYAAISPAEPISVATVTLCIKCCAAWIISTCRFPWHWQLGCFPCDEAAHSRPEFCTRRTRLRCLHECWPEINGV